MSKLHYITPTIPQVDVQSVRLGTNANQFKNLDSGKFVKLIGESAYGLCAAGDPIEGCINSVDTAPSGGYSIGGIVDDGLLMVTADGLQATPGTGTIALGDYVVCGSVTALGTVLPSFPKVCKATNQPGVAVTTASDNSKGQIDTALAALASAQANAMWAWRVVSLGTVGTGAVGTQIVIERVNDN